MAPAQEPRYFGGDALEVDTPDGPVSFSTSEAPEIVATIERYRRGSR
ncbi:hypothetical protein [Falsarthrobacter nasiphocae]|uniref:Uncharacterized protein n=1 Tax=Falsarthrobacter nasiphocae TaxID=189863 RepID=A0AAE3YFD2_9MICC|nr:hypothetical protein [Falsarthrobacter nasiphocae]MDR6891192.1 hypothetical protein [Falsarthrobacter nasiphocae]